MMPVFALSALFYTFTTVFCAGHVVQYEVKDGSNADGIIPLARINVDVSLRGNVSSGGRTPRLIGGSKGEKGERGKAGPPGRPPPENKCTCNCCQRLGDLEQRLANLTLLVKDVQNRSETKGKKYLTNCQNLKERGFTVSGVYTVDVDDGLDPFSVYCDMKTDGGGWTVFQRRQDGSVDFYRNWVDYKNGFGNLTGEFWLGLDKIHRLTKMPQVLRIELGDFSGNKRHAKYTNFTIANETMKYKIKFGQYSGNAGDSLRWHHGMKFTTKDSDNDIWGGNCAKTYKGAWWHSNCHRSNLNGIYIEDGTSMDGRGLRWYTWKSNVKKFTEMKVRLGD